MSDPVIDLAGHPILQVCGAVRAALTTVRDTNPTFMSTADKATALRELVVMESQVTELRLRVLADAGDVAADSGARDAGTWVAGETRTRPEDARADLSLARALDEHPALGCAVREGDVHLAQARVIFAALKHLPAEVPGEVVDLAETTLIDHARTFGPLQLARIGRRILDVVAPEIAEAAEARRLADLEAGAHRATRLSLRRCADGTTRIAGLLPDAVATRLATYLEAFTNPRQHPLGSTTEEPIQPEQSGTEEIRRVDPVARLSYPRRLGQAFCQLLESLDPLRLPVHGGNATTVVVTISLDDLRAQLATADLLGAGQIPGDPESQVSGETVTAAQARRLACNADIIPAVLGADSAVLDLGRTRRLFNHHQTRAMAIRHRVCRAEHCDIPARWCEAHHRDPWSHGGHTDIDDGVLLCSHHHHVVHDPTYIVELLPNGDLRFHRRTSPARRTH